MFENDSDGKLTKKERLAVVLALAASVAVHLTLFLGGGGFEAWSRKERKRERMMVIRQVRDIAPPEDIKEPSANRPQMQAHVQPLPPEPPPAGARPKAALPPSAAPPAAELKQAETPADAVTAEPELSEKMVEEVAETEAGKTEEKTAGEIGDNSLSVVTDLGSASFTVSGPQEYRGAGTFWLRKGAPPGRYTVAFLPVAGFSTPPAQEKDLAANGRIVFVGKYKKSREVVVRASIPNAQFTIFRPDGRPLEMNSPGRALFDDLPYGNYTAVFKDVPGYRTPGPAVRSFTGGGELAFEADYRQIGSAGGTGSGGRREAAPRADAAPKPSSPPPGAVLDRRVQMVVKSYPATSIEEEYDFIPYPERVIGRGDFQKGWCQVYLVVDVSAEGEVERIVVQRPRKEERAQFQELIDTVEKAVREWDYDKVPAEVNVDVRFYVE